jgi:hypothetical protein
MDENIPDIRRRSRAEIIRVETEIEISKLRRRAELDRINDYITFAALKLAGLSLSFIGAIGIFLPNSTSLVIHDPAGLLGVGIAILAGKKAAQIIGNLPKLLG